MVSRAYTIHKKGDKDIYILDTDVVKDMATQNAIMNVQQSLDVDFELSYEIMVDTCSIIAEKNLSNEGRNGLNSDDNDFLADADTITNVYTGVQLSYLSINNEDEISNIMKDEGHTSIAHACSSWYTQKVVQACEELSAYILQ